MTLEELDVDARSSSITAARTSPTPCLNDSDLGVKVMKHVAMRELGGWI